MGRLRVVHAIWLVVAGVHQQVFTVGGEGQRCTVDVVVECLSDGAVLSQEQEPPGVLIPVGSEDGVARVRQEPRGPGRRFSGDTVVEVDEVVGAQIGPVTHLVGPVPIGLPIPSVHAALAEGGE